MCVHIILYTVSCFQISSHPQKASLTLTQCASFQAISGSGISAESCLAWWDIPVIENDLLMSDAKRPSWQSTDAARSGDWKLETDTGTRWGRLGPGCCLCHVLRLSTNMRIESTSCDTSWLRLFRRVRMPHPCQRCHHQKTPWPNPQVG